MTNSSSIGYAGGDFLGLLSERHCEKLSVLNSFTFIIDSELSCVGSVMLAHVNEPATSTDAVKLCGRSNLSEKDLHIFDCATGFNFVIDTGEDVSIIPRKYKHRKCQLGSF